MTEPTRVEVTVLGERLSIRTTESPEYIRSLATHVEERAKALGAGTRSLSSVVLLTALDITDELFRTRDDRMRLDGDVRARLGALVNELHRVNESP